jgi:hypothetical protein
MSTSSVVIRQRILVSPRGVASAVGAVAIVVNAVGCSAPTAPVDATPAAVESASATPSVPREPTVTDGASCEAFGDVLTIHQNAMVGLTEGRMTQHEYDGWMRLATRVLDRVPTRGEGAVSESIAALQEAAPAVRLGAMGSTTIGTSDWYNAASLADACTAAGYQLAAEGFTGG